jgi:membrane glycosyltransferase
MQVHYTITFVAALVPIITGFIWYNPKVFGNAWMKSIHMSPENMKGGNMAITLGLAYLFSVLLAVSLVSIVIHQTSILSVFNGDNSAESAAYMKNFFETYGGRFRTFKHGSLHGVISGFFIALPILGINALFERRGFTYIAIHTGYWMLTLGIMGGIICQFA